MEVSHHRSFDISNIYNYKYVSEPWLYQMLLDVRNYFETIYKIWISYKQQIWSFLNFYISANIKCTKRAEKLFKKNHTYKSKLRDECWRCIKYFKNQV